MPPTTNYFLPQFQSALGTVVHATPLVEALRAAQPQARIIVASSGLAAQVWQGNPHLEDLLITPNPLTEMLAAIRAWRAAKLFKGERYTTLLTTGNERTRITLAAVLAGRSTRVGFAVHGALVQQHLVFDTAASQIANNLRLLQSIGLASPTAAEPILYPDGVRSLLPARSGPGQANLRIALATQTSPTQRKSWRAERWIEVVEALHRSEHIDFIFVGTSAEVPAINALRERISFPTLSVAGRTDIPQLAATLADCDLGIVLDTGPLHVARGVGLPAVVIAPAWSPVHEWLPIGNPRYRILKNADFPPPAPNDYVIDEVTVDQVLKAARELMATCCSGFEAVERTPGS